MRHTCVCLCVHVYVYAHVFIWDTKWKQDKEAMEQF